MDLFVRVGIEFARIALRQKLRVSGNHAEWFLQLAGGDISKLLEIPIGTCQFVLRLLVSPATTYFAGALDF